jgi:hypothetical protein
MPMTFDPQYRSDIVEGCQVAADPVRDGDGQP